VSDSGRVADLDSAVNAYRRALDSTPVEEDERLSLSIELANTLVARAAATRQGGAGTLEEAISIVARAAAGNRDRLAMNRLLPVLRAAFRKHDRWQA
jgi:hypothetical protein